MTKRHSSCASRRHSSVAFGGMVAVAGLFSATAEATDFYVDPATGAASNDGSQAKPWQTLETVVKDGHFGKEIKAGDTVWVKAGYHGAFAVNGGTYDPPISVIAVSGEKPKVSQISFNNAHGFVVGGFSVSPSHAPAPKTGIDMVSIAESSSDVTVKNCDIFSVTDASAFTEDDWVNKTSSGVMARGARSVVSHNAIKNVRFGIQAAAVDVHVDHNQVVNFSADGLRGLGDNDVFEYNVVKNAYVADPADDNHDDGFQSWSGGFHDTPGSTEVKGIVLRGNFILNREDPNQPFQNSLQGIGCFDGFFTGWVVENNVVVTDHWHGISFLGMKDSRIVNNTVIDVNDKSPGPPWIMVNPHKDGRVSENVIVRNNLATDYDLKGTNVTDDHNATLKDLGVYFVDPAKFDLHLLPDAPAVNAGSADQAPALDFDGIPRPQGTAVDQGAFEWHDPSVMPVDGGATPGAGGDSADDAGSSAGAPGAGGRASATGGTTGTNPGGGKNGGGAPATAGASSGSGDGGGENSSDAGTASAKSGDSGNCSCRIGNTAASGGWLWAAAGLAAVAACRRRRVPR